MAISNPERMIKLEDMECPRVTLACFNRDTYVLEGQFGLPEDSIDVETIHPSIEDARRQAMVVLPVKNENGVIITSPSNLGHNKITVWEVLDQLDIENSQQITGCTLEDFAASENKQNG